MANDVSPVCSKIRVDWPLRSRNGWLSRGSRPSSLSASPGYAWCVLEEKGGLDTLPMLSPWFVGYSVRRPLSLRSLSRTTLVAGASNVLSVPSHLRR